MKTLSEIRIIAVVILLIAVGCKDKRQEQHQHNHHNHASQDSIPPINLNALLKPANELVVANIPVTKLLQKTERPVIVALGTVTYDTRFIGNIPAKVSGRIEKLFVKYRFQDIDKGEKIMEIYSSEIVTAQQNLLFLLSNSPGDSSMLHAAKQKLLLLGMAENQVSRLIETKKVMMTVGVYSSYAGHIHESGKYSSGMGRQSTSDAAMNNSEELATKELSLKEGMYVQKGENLFEVYNPHHLWALLSIYPQHASLVKKGNKVVLQFESDTDQIDGRIIFIEPFYREGSKTITARVEMSGSRFIPVGSQVKALIESDSITGNWLLREAVLSLGFKKVVFVKTQDAFQAEEIQTGMETEKWIQVLDGLSANDSIASNAHYLVDSESFIKVKN